MKCKAFYFIIIELTLFAIAMLLLVYPPLLNEELGDYICDKEYGGTYRAYYNGILACNVPYGETQRFDYYKIVIKKTSVDNKYHLEDDR